MASAADEDGEALDCLTCCEPITIGSVGACNHVCLCWKCALRMRKFFNGTTAYTPTQPCVHYPLLTHTCCSRTLKPHVGDCSDKRCPMCKVQGQSVVLGALHNSLFLTHAFVPHRSFNQADQPRVVLTTSLKRPFEDFHKLSLTLEPKTQTLLDGPLVNETVQDALGLVCPHCHAHKHKQ